MRRLFMLRLAAPVLAVSVLLLGLGGWGAWWLYRLQNESSQLVAKSVASVRAAEELVLAFREVRTRLYLFLLNGEAKELETIPALKSEISRWLARAEQAAVTAHERELLARVHRGHERLFVELDRIRGERPTPRQAARLQALADHLLTEEVLQPTTEYLDFNEEQAEQASAANQVAAQRVGLGMVLLGICGSLGGLLAGQGLARAVRRSLVQLSDPIRDATGLLEQVTGPLPVAPGQDIQEMAAALRALAEQIGRVVARLQDSQRQAPRNAQLALMGQLAASVAHELCNPLTSIKMLAEGLRQESEQRGQSVEDFLVIERAVERLTRDLQSFLDFARPPAPQRQRVALQSVVEQGLALVRGLARRQNVVVQFEPGAGPLWVDADPGQIQQVLVNLLLNAIQAQPRGGHIQIGLDLPAEGLVEVRVLDRGPGIDPHLLPRLFQPFVTTKEAGLGLGLAVSRGIAESHGGSLQAANRLEGGACFLLRLPRASGPGGETCSWEH